MHPKKKISIQAVAEGEGRDGVKSLPSSSLERILLSNQHAALHGDSIGTLLAVARIPHNQEAGRGLVGGSGVLMLGRGACFELGG